MIAVAAQDTSLYNPRRSSILAQDLRKVRNAMRLSGEAASFGDKREATRWAKYAAKATAWLVRHARELAS